MIWIYQLFSRISLKVQPKHVYQTPLDYLRNKWFWIYHFFTFQYFYNHYSGSWDILKSLTTCPLVMSWSTATATASVPRPRSRRVLLIVSPFRIGVTGLSRRAIESLSPFVADWSPTVQLVQRRTVSAVRGITSRHACRREEKRDRRTKRRR